jgi:hypothetical protein
MELSFDQAIELLEITDIAKIQMEDVSQLEKKMKKRWHPDRVSHLNDPITTHEYTSKFQQIEMACQMVISFLDGTYQAGEAFTYSTNQENAEPETIIRENAPDIQETLKDLWSLIQEKKYKWNEEEVLLSDGFKLKDLLREDFKEDIAMLSVVSFFYGLIFFGLVSMIGHLISPVIGTLVSILWGLQALSCSLGLLPLSRFWLPLTVQNVMVWFINFGLKIYYWAESESSVAAWWIQLLVAIPNLFALAIKFILLFPLYEIAKAVVNDKIVGIVTKKVDYYAGAAVWYINDLLTKNPIDMSSDELFHLSYIYSELSDVKSMS